jgi:hypothetical protein
MYFNEFMDELSKRHDLHKKVNGTQVELTIVLSHRTAVEIVYDAVDREKRAYIRSGCMVPPITKDGRSKFMNFILDFNRNAISVMDVGIMPHPKSDAAFTPTWYVPKGDYSYREWEVCLHTYEGIVKNASSEVSRMMLEWTHYLH